MLCLCSPMLWEQCGTEGSNSQVRGWRREEGKRYYCWMATGKGRIRARTEGEGPIVLVEPVPSTQQLLFYHRAGCRNWDSQQVQAGCGW